MVDEAQFSLRNSMVSDCFAGRIRCVARYPGAGGALKGNGAAYSGGWHWQSASMNLWESFTCVAMSYGLLVIFLESSTRRDVWRSSCRRMLSAFTFFIPPSSSLAARVLHCFSWPAILKFVDSHLHCCCRVLCIERRRVSSNPLPSEDSLIAWTALRPEKSPTRSFPRLG